MYVSKNLSSCNKYYSEWLTTVLQLVIDLTPVIDSISGKQVIAGIVDGQLGILVDRGNGQQIEEAISKEILNKESYVLDIELLMKKIGYEGYIESCRELLKM